MTQRVLQKVRIHFSTPWGFLVSIKYSVFRLGLEFSYLLHLKQRSDELCTIPFSLVLSTPPIDATCYFSALSLICFRFRLFSVVGWCLPTCLAEGWSSNVGVERSGAVVASQAEGGLLSWEAVSCVLLLFMLCCWSHRQQLNGTSCSVANTSDRRYREPRTEFLSTEPRPFAGWDVTHCSGCVGVWNYMRCFNLLIRIGDISICIKAKTKRRQ
jgi:hypothetical protein